MAEIQGNSKKLSDLLWAIDGTRRLSCESISKQEGEILSMINKKISKIKALGCEGIQEKFKKFDQDNAITYLAELVVAEYFLNHESKVILLGSEYFPKASPDIFVKTKNGHLFIEVLYMSSSDPTSVLIDKLQEITEKYPYVINFLFATDVSLPHNNWNERSQQLKKLELAVTQFELDLQQIKLKTLPYHGKTDSFSYEIIEKNPSGKGYPAILTSACSTSLDFSNAYLTLRLIKKAEKRLSFPPHKQRIPYIVALVCDEPGINAGEVCFLLFGTTVQYDCFPLTGISEEVIKRQKNKKWNEILQELSSQGSWEEIQKAKENGWDELLSMTYLIPHDYCYVKEPGIFITNEIIHQVSGVLFSRIGGNYTLFPNPFSIDKMEYSPFWRDL